MQKILESWQSLLREFKENLARRLWSMPTVSEPEKEMVFKEYLSDLTKLENTISNFYESQVSQTKVNKEENDLLRGLLGIPGDELKTRVFSIGNDLTSARQKANELEEELGVVKEKLDAAQIENVDLRKRLRQAEEVSQKDKEDHLKVRDSDIRRYAETHDVLKNQILDLESRLSNLRQLFTESNKKLATEKQEEIALLQKKILDEMEDTLRQNRQLSWAEEEMFAKGVAQRVRTVLVSAQGQLFLTLERLGLMDPESKNESFWKTRFKIFVEGAEDLGKNFRSLQTQLQEVTKALDDYLHLTHRREMNFEPVSLLSLVKKEMAGLYLDRLPALTFEVLPDDPLPDVPGDGEFLQFTVTTLIQNSVEALPNKAGRISISIKNRPDKNRVEFMIHDSGKGIPAHLQPRLFHPFFTAKPGHQGLSLSRAKRYVELHGGTLDLLESSNEGTTFQMNLKLKREK